jgi:hypothetical protein
LPYYRQWNVLAEQRYLTDFSQPENTVALTNLPAECDRLFPTGKYVVVPVCGEDRGYRGFMPAGAPIGDKGGFPTLFLHARQSTSGHERLVHVTLNMLSDSVALAKGLPFMPADEAVRCEDWHIHSVYFTKLVFQDEIYQPATRQPGSTLRPAPSGTLGAWPKLVSFIVPRVAETKIRSMAPGGALDLIRGDDQKLRIMVGRPDPKDPSRFEIPYECDDRPGIVEGRLENDDSITWNIVSGPLHPWP